MTDHKTAVEPLESRVCLSMAPMPWYAMQPHAVVGKTQLSYLQSSGAVAAPATLGVMSVQSYHVSGADGMSVDFAVFHAPTGATFIIGESHFAPIMPHADFDRVVGGYGGYGRMYRMHRGMPPFFARPDYDDRSNTVVTPPPTFQTPVSPPLPEIPATPATDPGTPVGQPVVPDPVAKPPAEGVVTAPPVHRGVSHSGVEVVINTAAASAAQAVIPAAIATANAADALAAQVSHVAEVLQGESSTPAVSFVPIASKVGSPLAGHSINFNTAIAAVTDYSLSRATSDVASAVAGQVAGRLKDAMAELASAFVMPQQALEFAHLGSPYALLADSMANFIDESASIPMAPSFSFVSSAYAPTAGPWAITFTVLAADVVILTYMHRRRTRQYRYCA